MAVQGATVTIDPVVMQSAAQIIDTQRSTIENCLSSILRDANSLKSVWEGEGASAYQAAISKIEENSPILVSVLKEYVLDLNKIASDFISKDNEIKVNSEVLPTAFID